MSYSATIRGKDAMTLGRYDTIRAAWRSLMDFHEDRLAQAGSQVDDRVWRRMELREDSGITGIVSGPDPLDPAETVTYSVQDW